MYINVDNSKIEQQHKNHRNYANTSQKLGVFLMKFWWFGINYVISMAQGWLLLAGRLVGEATPHRIQRKTSLKRLKLGFLAVFNGFRSIM